MKGENCNKKQQWKWLWWFWQITPLVIEVFVAG